MASILTNTSAMVALQTLRGINMNLEDVQSQISTGKAVSSAKDNAAVWAISKVMESDVNGFKSISDSLSLGESTVAVARQASETVTDLLTQIQGKIVAAQEENVDRQKIQTDITQLTKQIESVVNAAQFNGLNLLKDDSAVAGSGTVNVLSSLDRQSDGTVTSSNIEVRKQDLLQTAASFGAASATSGSLMTISGGTIAISGGSGTVSFTTDGSTYGASYRVSLTGAGTQEIGTSAVTFDYVARDGDTELDVSAALYDQISQYFTDQGFADTSIARNASTGVLTITNADTTTGNTVALAITENTGGTAQGGLAALAGIDVTTTVGAEDALSQIEGLIQTSIDAAAVFGSAQNRIEVQSDFIGKLSDALKAGIGTLVDADMEEASARLQALQVQQQLGIQSLSIANQAPQSILSLFR